MVDKREFCFVLLIVAYNIVAQRQKTKVVLKSTVELYGVYDTVEMYKKQIKKNKLLQLGWEPVISLGALYDDEDLRRYVRCWIT